jgi:plastocyanin
LKWAIKELTAIIILCLGLFVLPVIIFHHAPWVQAGETRVIYLTAVTKNGVWTDERVNSGNLWRKTFKPTTVKIKQNERVILRLSSADVTHTFYVPELNIGPVEVDPGQIEEVTISVNVPGEYLYYCIIVCGECHYYMQGKVVVIPENEIVVPVELAGVDQCDKDHFVPTNSDFVEWGGELFVKKSCVTCHGEHGRGGVLNPNYINKSVPELNTLADKLKIYWQEDAEIIIKLLSEHANLDSLEDDPPIENYGRFLAQYHSMLAKIKDGASKLQTENSDGPVPPLYMPAWEHIINDNEIDAVLAYLISQFDWEE